MKAHLTRRYRFSASHRLHNPGFSDAENLRTYGKCSNPHGHGHNYGLAVTVAGQVDPRTGMVCNLADLDAFVERRVLEVFGHEHLNDLPPFAGLVPTTENLARVIHRLLAEEFRAAEVEEVQIEETSLNSFAYAGEKEVRK